MHSHLFLFLLTLITIHASDRGIPSDIKYIRCETCEHISLNLISQLNDESTTKPSQLEIYDIVESLCSPSTKQGRWLKKVDLVERLGKLRLIAQQGQQDCNRECKTLALACENVLDGIESELADHLYAQLKTDQLKQTHLHNFLCAKRSGLSSACKKQPPKLPRDRPPGPSFQPKSEKDVNMDNLMETLREANGGQDYNLDMMNRDQVQAGMNAANDDDDEDDEAEEEMEAQRPKDLPDQQNANARDMGSIELGEDLKFEEQHIAAGAAKAAAADAASDEL